MRGMTCRRIGQSGLFGSIRLKKCGVMASASLSAREQDAGALLVGEGQMLLELRQGRDAILELPFPVIPEFGRDIREITGRHGDELFSVLFAVGKSKHFDF